MASSLPLSWGDYRHGLDTAMILHSKLIVNLNYSIHYYNVFTYKMMCDNMYIEEFRRSNARVFLPARLTCGSRTGVPFFISIIIIPIAKSTRALTVKSISLVDFFYFTMRNACLLFSPFSLGPFRRPACSGGGD